MTRRHAGWAIAAAALALGMTLASPARAYVRTKTDQGAAVHWREPCIYITAHVTDAPANLTPELAASAARAAAATWSNPQIDCTALQLQVAVSEAADAPVGNDKHSNLVFRKETCPCGSWCRQPAASDEACYDSSALAITTVFAQQKDGVVLDADTEINAVDFQWGDLVEGIGSAGTNVQDLQNTLTHEFGHLLGLDHNCYSYNDRSRGIDQDGKAVPDCNRAPPSVQAATMYASVMRGDILRRTLSSDDVDGVCAIYPVAGTPTCAAVMDGDPPAQPSADDGGGCSFGGALGSAGSALLVVLLAIAALAARRLAVVRDRGPRRRRRHPSD